MVQGRGCGSGGLVQSSVLSTSGQWPPSFATASTSTAARVITTVCWLDGWSWPICDSGDLHRSVTTPVQWWTRRYESVFNLQITALTWRIMFLFYVCVQNRRTLGWDIFVGWCFKNKIWSSFVQPTTVCLLCTMNVWLWDVDEWLDVIKSRKPQEVQYLIAALCLPGV